jgi:peptidoglycan/xylan/chitin deacetylase (PgdA/CDA1 family)
VRTTVPVLLYHCVSADGGGVMGRYTMAPSVFRAHMAWIAEHGFQTLTVSAYARSLRGEGPLPARPVVVTFDDGYADFVDEAFPVLAEYGIRVTLYVTTRPVEQTMYGRPVLSWSELRQLAGLGVEIGAHSHDHVQLDLLSRSATADQVTTCKRLLEEHLETEVRSFAYPHGYNSARTRAAVRAAGYSSACAVKNRLSHDQDDPWAIARIMFERGADTGVLRRFPLAGHLWRVARRLRTYATGPYR